MQQVEDLLLARGQFLSADGGWEQRFAVGDNADDGGSRPLRAVSRTSQRAGSTVEGLARSCSIALDGLARTEVRRPRRATLGRSFGECYPRRTA